MKKFEHIENQITTTSPEKINNNVRSVGEWGPVYESKNRHKMWFYLNDIPIIWNILGGSVISLINDPPTQIWALCPLVSH